MDRDKATFRLTVLYAGLAGVLAVLYRLLPHYVLGDPNNLLANLMPMGALALFAGSRLRSPVALVLPLLAMGLADLLLIPALARLGYSSFDAVTPFVYLGYLLYFLIGRLIPARSLSPIRLGGAAVTGGLAFFVLTNLGCWIMGLYPRTLQGLVTCFELAIPFYRGTLLSDVVFTGLFFYTHALVIFLAPALLATGRPVGVLPLVETPITTTKVESVR